MQTSTILSIFFAAFILDIFRSINSSKDNDKKNSSNNYNNYNFQNQKHFQNEKLNNPSMKIKDETGEDIKISYDGINNRKKKSIIYLTIQFCQS